MNEQGVELEVERAVLLDRLKHRRQRGTQVHGALYRASADAFIGAFMLGAYMGAAACR